MTLQLYKLCKLKFKIEPQSEELTMPFLSRSINQIGKDVSETGASH